MHLLEAIRIVDPTIRFYQASTSEMFGKVQAVPQTEDTPFYPRSPYGVAKLYAHWMTVNYRESYGIFGTQRHPVQSRVAAARPRVRDAQDHRLGRQDQARQARRAGARQPRCEARLGLRKEYVDGMWRMLQADEPDTFVLATNRTETVRDFVAWPQGGGHRSRVRGRTANTRRAVDRRSADGVMRINPRFYRPAEVDLLIGDPARPKRELGWKAKTTLEELCRMMVEADLRRNASGQSF